MHATETGVRVPRISLIQIVLLCAFSVHLIAYSYTFKRPNVVMTADSPQYLYAADNLRRSGVVYAGNLSEPIDPGLYTRRPPCYPLFIALLQMIWESPFSVTLAQVGLNLLNVYLLWSILGLVGARGKVRLVVVAVYLFYPAQIIYTHMVMAEILLQTLLLSATYFLALFVRNKRLPFLALFDLSLCLAMLTKPVLLYLWLPNVVFHLFLLWRSRKRSVLILGLLPVVTILLWSTRNYSKTGYFHFTSIKNHNLLHYNTYLLLTNRFGQSEADRFLSNMESEMSQLDFAEANRLIERRCIKTIMENPFDYAAYHLRGAILFFFDPGRFDIYQFLGYAKGKGFLFSLSEHGLPGVREVVSNIPATILGYLALMLVANTVLVASFAHFTFGTTSFLEIKWFAVLLIAYLAIVTGPLGASRFRIVVMPQLLLTLPGLWASLRRPVAPPHSPL